VRQTPHQNCFIHSLSLKEQKDLPSLASEARYIGKSLSNDSIKGLAPDVKPKQKKPALKIAPGSDFEF
jgi:hypothetical protein